MVITFDFDDTLLWTAVERDADGEYLDHGPIGKNPHVFPRLLQALDSGAEVHIVTSRRSRTRPEVLAWLEEWGVLDRLAGVHFTEGQLKHDTLERLGSEQHFDDDPEELAHLPRGCRGVRAPLHDSWTERLDERRYIASSRSVEMRRMRLMGREEQLLREAVRGMLQEVDPETERLSGVLRVPVQKKGDLEDVALKVGVTSDIMGALANIGGDSPAVMGINIGADIISMSAATYLMRKEAKRCGVAMTALSRLQAMNDFHFNASGSYTYDPEDLKKFDLYYTTRNVIAAVQYLLSIIAATSSVLGLIPGVGGATGSASVAEWSAKGVKLALVGLTAADALGKIDLSQLVTDILSNITDAWETISSKSEYAAIVNTYTPKVAEIFSNPAIRASITAAVMTQNPALRSVADDITQSVATITTALPKLQAERG